MESSLWEKYPLLNTMMKLRKARFNASERLSKRYRWHSISLVVFSIYALSLSILPKYISFGQAETNDIIGFATVVSSVFVVALSVYSAFSEDVVRGKYLHDNAKQVSNIYHEYKLQIDECETKGGKPPETMGFEQKYRIIMDACPYNHDQVDYQSIRSELEKLNWFEKSVIWVSVNASLYFWPIIAIAGPPAVMLVGMYYYVGP